MKRNFVLGALCSLSVSAIAAETPDVKEGLWEISSQASIPSMSMQYLH